VAGRAQEYRQNAQTCLKMACTCRSAEARATLVHMARVWAALAETYADKRPAAATEPSQVQQHPPVQQQQQIQPKNVKKE
jgi:hypothetical protein